MGAYACRGHARADKCNSLWWWYTIKNTNSTLLDSSLITAYRDKYQAKIIRCGDYIQLYFYEYPKTKKQTKEKKDIDFLFKSENIEKKDEFQTIEHKNAMRSLFSLQRLVKTNEPKFINGTFITLTFKNTDKFNINDIKTTNKKFHSWVTNIRKLKKDFTCIYVPEFQKRGAVHYHLITNLNINEDVNIILPQIDKENCYDVKYWSHGFSSVFPLKDMNVVGYISKYMTKDIDNRLFGKRRYSYCGDIEKPIEDYIDLEKHPNYIEQLTQNKDLKYYNNYLDYFGNNVKFIEMK